VDEVHPFPALPIWALAIFSMYVNYFLKFIIYVFKASEIGTLPKSGTIPRGMSPGPAAVNF
jgi:hypothetical protein